MNANIENYDEQCVIGNGAYGTVYKAKDKLTGDFVALKKVKVPQGEEGIPMSTMREIALLKSMASFGHPHIIKLLDVVIGEHLQSERVLLMYLVFEFVDQDLAVYMERCPPPGLPAFKVKALFVATANARYGSNYKVPIVAPAAPLYKAPEVKAATTPDSYSYSYKVADDLTGDKKEAIENSKDKKVTGEYKVEQPDGCVRHVTYVANEDGYQPTITYSGTCNPESYMAAAVPAELKEVEKENLAKAATDSALAAAQYKAVVESHKHIVAEHEKMKAEMKAEAERNASQKKNIAMVKQAVPATYSAQAYASPAVEVPAAKHAPAYAAPMVKEAPVYAAPKAYEALVVKQATLYTSQTTAAAVAKTVDAAPKAYESAIVKQVPVYAAPATTAPIVKKATSYAAPKAYEAPTLNQASADATPVVKEAPVYAAPKAYEAPVVMQAPVYAAPASAAPDAGKAKAYAAPKAYEAPAAAPVVKEVPVYAATKTYEAPAVKQSPKSHKAVEAPTPAPTTQEPAAAATAAPKPLPYFRPAAAPRY